MDAPEVRGIGAEGIRFPLLYRPSNMPRGMLITLSDWPSNLRRRKSKLSPSKCRRIHRMKRITLLALCAVALCGAAPGKSAPEVRHNLELERQLQAVAAKSPDAWGVSVRHMERHEVAGARADDRFLMAGVFKVPIL